MLFRSTAATTSQKAALSESDGGKLECSKSSGTWVRLDRLNPTLEKGFKRKYKSPFFAGTTDVAWWRSGDYSFLYAINDGVDSQWLWLDICKHGIQCIFSSLSVVWAFWKKGVAPQVGLQIRVWGSITCWCQCFQYFGNWSRTIYRTYSISGTRRGDSGEGTTGPSRRPPHHVINYHRKILIVMDLMAFAIQTNKKFQVLWIDWRSWKLLFSSFWECYHSFLFHVLWRRCTRACHCLPTLCKTRLCSEPSRNNLVTEHQLLWQAWGEYQPYK